jgi:hypothetical protein
MIDPNELIEECKSHLRDNTTHEQQYKTDIRKLITALERALSLGYVVGQSEQLKCGVLGGVCPYETGDRLCRAEFKCENQVAF